MFRLKQSAAVALLAALLPGSPYAADRAATALAPYLARQYVFVDSPAVTQYLESIVQRLLDTQGGKAQMPRLMVYSSDSFNLFTDAAGLLVVSTGALRSMSSEDELAAALSHELSHLLLGHPHQKDSLRAFPLGVETMEAVVIAASKLRGNGRPPSGDLSRYGGQGLVSTQAASLLWSDILFPGFNRKQERAADQRGFDLMQAAGYDPSAFGDLFQKLAVAAAKRSARLEVLKNVMISRAQARAKPIASQQQKGLKAEATQLAEGVRSKLSRSAVETVIDGIAGLSREYDSPDQRQAMLANYAGTHVPAKGVVRAASRFQANLRRGGGKQLLDADAAGLVLLDALAGGKTEEARRQSAVLARAGATLPSAHLHLPLGAWSENQQQRALADRHARDWAASRLAPSQAYLWAASAAALRKDYSGAVQVLQQGRAQVGNAAPFLPPLVSMARAAGRRQEAEDFTMECRKEDDRNAGARITAMFRADALPTGLYAECVGRLGYEPEKAKEQNAAVRMLKKPVEAGKQLTKKVRDKMDKD
ncbi:MAG: M48 family metalloprotease [Steroidobacteraceae bacterium]